MKYTTDTEFLKEIKAQEELEHRGFVKQKCPTCNGEGSVGLSAWTCERCAGKGYYWKPPLVR